jgi:hypothetical protein
MGAMAEAEHEGCMENQAASSSSASKGAANRCPDSGL